MPNKKGDTEITIPTFESMQFIHSDDESQIIIRSATGTITIKCFSHHKKCVSEGQPG
jgi:hypothetical protein